MNVSEVSNNNRQKVNFKGYRGAEFYGCPDNRKALNYKTLLTTEKIDEIIKSAPTLDEGILNAYKEISSEHQNVKAAFGGFNVIIRQYFEVMKRRMDKIMKMDPKGSRIPIVGYVSKYTAMLTDKFINRVIREARSLGDDYTDIIEKYFNNGLNNVLNNYLKVNKHLSDGVDYVNIVKGPNELRNQVSEKLKKNRDTYITNYDKLNLSLGEMEQKVNLALVKLVEKQQKKQNTKFIISSVRKLITLGFT